MNANEYQAKAHSFANYGDGIMYPFLGLSEEAGEVNGKLAKFIRKNCCAPVSRSDFDFLRDVMGADEKTVTEHEKFNADLVKELGDVLWMVAECATIFGLKLEDIMAYNIEKLTDRKQRGVIVGEGDNR